MNNVGFNGADFEEKGTFRWKFTLGLNNKIIIIIIQNVMCLGLIIAINILIYCYFKN